MKGTIMRRSLIAVSLLFGFATIALAAGDTTTLKNYQPGFRLIDGSQLNKMVGQVNTINSGLATYAGETALTGANPKAVTTGLTTISSCHASIKTSVAPALSTSVLTYTTSAGTLNVYGWMPTSISNPTLIASTGTDTIGWICSGTK